jgi:hypothetical protein
MDLLTHGDNNIIMNLWMENGILNLYRYESHSRLRITKICPMIMMIIIDASVSNDPSSGDDDALWRVSPPNLSRRSRFGIFGGSLSRFSDLTSRREYI